MSSQSFPTPVRVVIKDSRQNIITNAWDAVEFLRRWPGKHDNSYRRALQHCLDALDGIRSAKAAFASFVAAARQAGILA